MLKSNICASSPLKASKHTKLVEYFKCYWESKHLEDAEEGQKSVFVRENVFLKLDQ